MSKTEGPGKSSGFFVWSADSRKTLLPDSDPDSTATIDSSIETQE